MKQDNPTKVRSLADLVQSSVNLNTEVSGTLQNETGNVISHRPKTSRSAKQQQQGRQQQKAAAVTTAAAAHIGGIIIKTRLIVKVHGGDDDNNLLWSFSL